MSNMWLFTPDGFFSPRYDEFCKENEVMIRARCRDDLVKLAKIVGQKRYKIVEIPEADYLYRMKINKNAWAGYCARAALDDRPTSVTGGLKNEEKLDNRYLTYLSIWYSMILLQEFYDAERKGDVKKMKELDKIFEESYF
jgi:hypothetical protein